MDTHNKNSGIDPLNDSGDVHQSPQEEVVLRPDDTVTVSTPQFPIQVMRRQDFEVAVASETLGTYSDASVVVSSGGQQSEPQDIVFERADPEGTRTIGAGIRFRPGHNNLAFFLRDGTTGHVDPADLNVTIPGRSYTSEGIEFLLHEQSQTVSDAALDQVAALTRLMNGYLQHPVSEVVIRDDEFPAGEASGGDLALSRFNFDNPNREPNGIAWHELAHFYYAELQGGEYYYRLEQNQQAAYGVEFRALYQEALRLSLIEGATDQKRTSIRANSVIELFDAPLYIAAGGQHLGAPHAHEGELFAYGSDVLLFHSDEFLQRVSRLESEAERQLALQLAAKIAGSYVKDGALPEALQALQKF